MNESTIIEYITSTFDGVDLVTADGNSFFSCDPGDGLPADRGFLPFATLVTNDLSDQASNLERRGVYRLNIGIGKETFQSLFGAQTSARDEAGGNGYDFTALDRLMPHPVYGKLFWVCVLNPSDATFQTVKPLLAEAYGRAIGKRAKGKTREQS